MIGATNLKLGEWQWFIELEEVCNVFRKKGVRAH
jgi:hypothetical protein